MQSTHDEARQKNFGLTSREREIVSAVLAGYSNEEIAEYLKISEDSVRDHLSNIFDKLGVSTRLEIALLCVGPDDADEAGIAVQQPTSPHLNSGSAARVWTNSSGYRTGSERDRLVRATQALTRHIRGIIFDHSLIR